MAFQPILLRKALVFPGFFFFFLVCSHIRQMYGEYCADVQSDNAAYKKRAEGVVPPLTYSGLPMLGQAPQLKGYTNQSMVQLNNGRSTEEFCNIVQLKIPKVSENKIEKEVSPFQK
jgi:hypothetical protein